MTANLIPYSNECLLTFGLVFALASVRGWLVSLYSAFLLAFILLASPGIHPGTSALLDLVSSSDRNVFGILTTLLGIVIGLYSDIYMRESHHRARFFINLALFEGACLLVLYSDHLLLFLTGWELTAILGSFLIGFRLSSYTAQRAARQSQLITNLGGLFLFAALVFLSEQRGSYSISILSSAWEGIPPALAYFSFAAVLLAAITKSAQFPFQFWLPQAMQAPTPVSAFLHSASLVNLGIFLLILFKPLFSVMIGFHIFLTGIGLLTFASSSLIAVFVSDLKLALASTTTAQLGLIMTLVGLKNERALSIAFVILIGHAFYKAALFLGVGVIQKVKQTQDLWHTGFLYREQKWLWIALVLSAASMIGLPPFLSFFAKEQALDLFAGPFAAQGAKYYTWITASIGFLASSVFGILLILSTFYSQDEGVPQKFTYPNRKVYFVGILSLLGFLLGVIPGLIIFRKDFSPFSGVALVWGLAILLLSTGIAFYFVRLKTFRSKKAQEFLNRFSPAKFFDWITLSQSERLAQKITSWTIDFFSKHAEMIIGLSILAILLRSFELKRISFSSTADPRTFIFEFLVLLTGVFSVGVLFFKNWKAKVFSLAAAGSSVVICFAAFGAPDLVLTQGLVEVASLLLWIWAFKSLGKNADLEAVESKEQFGSISKWVLSIALAFALLILFSEPTLLRMHKLSSIYFFENAATAGGLDLVNLIVVDFRGLDTLGEITVLAIAYFGCRALGEKKVLYSKPYGDWIKAFAPFFSWAFMVVSIGLLLRGHKFPGGGFIGGVLLALGLLLKNILSSESRTRWQSLVVGGITVAYASSIFPAIISKDFFESFSTWFGPSSLLFDAGVYLAVAGSVGGILELFLSELTARRKRGENAA